MNDVNEDKDPEPQNDRVSGSLNCSHVLRGLTARHLWNLIDDAHDTDKVPCWAAKAVLADLRETLSVLSDLPAGMVGRLSARVFSNLDGDDDEANEIDGWLKRRRACVGD